eukprot:1393385-Pyramimonas_sp.AAC.1
MVEGSGSGRSLGSGPPRASGGGGPSEATSTAPGRFPGGRICPRRAANRTESSNSAPRGS